MTVSQHVALNRPTASITLAVDKRTTEISGGVFHPRIRNLQVMVEASPPLTYKEVLKPGDVFTVALPDPTRRFKLIYTAYGTVRRSIPSSAQRALALVNSVTIAPTERITNTIAFRGANVINIGCVEFSGTAVTCASQTADRWTVTQAPGERETAMVAQLDLDVSALP